MDNIVLNFRQLKAIHDFVQRHYGASATNIVQSFQDNALNESLTFSDDLHKYSKKTKGSKKIPKKDIDNVEKNYKFINYITNVRSSIVDESLRLAKEGMQMKEWYEEISSKIYVDLGESDGCLFLMLLALTSTRNLLQRNFTEASLIFKGLKKDIKEGRENRLRDFVNRDQSVKFTYDEGSEFSDLAFIYAMKRYKLSDTTAKIKNFTKVLKLYLDNNMVFTKDICRTYLTSQFNLDSVDIKGIVNLEETISASKVLNFSVNLLFPEEEFVINKHKWYFVTIDAWMLKVFYPELDNEARGRFMDHKLKYIRLQREIVRIAKSVGMKPHQFQAAVWCAKLIESGKPIHSFEVALENRIRDMKRHNGDLYNVKTTLSSVIDGLHDTFVVKGYKDEKEK